MSTETAGDIAFVNYVYLHTLYMNYCAPQHLQLPLWPMEKLASKGDRASSDDVQTTVSLHEFFDLANVQAPA